MSTKKMFLVAIILAFSSLNIYLFATAPPPLQDEVNTTENTYSIEEAFTVVAKINDAARTFYTKQIVGKGIAAGLKFHENWRDNDTEAGPLPALFLRGISSYIEKSTVPLGLYLGSDFPIVEANLFEGIQAEKFKEIRKTKEPQFFYDNDTERYYAMFPDFAGAQACVKCHNEHENSPKTDWNLNDIMGATTWSFPEDSVSTDELVAIIKIYNDGVSDIYKSYLEEAKGFQTLPIPVIGNNWPANGYNLPTLQVLGDTLSKLTSEIISNSILKNEK